MNKKEKLDEEDFLITSFSLLPKRLACLSDKGREKLKWLLYSSNIL